MDLMNFVQTGGFPVKTERLQEMQTAYSVFNKLGELSGNLTIVSGCTVIGTSVSDGCVVVDGEVLNFKGGFISETVVVIAEESAKEFENGELKVVHYERYVTFGIGETSYLFEDFVKIDPIVVLMQRISKLERKTAVFTAGGGMTLWQKAAYLIPPGWQEVENWRGRLPIGVSADEIEFATIGKEGGFKTHTLTIPQLPIVSPVGANGFLKGGTLGGGVAVTRNDYSSGTFGAGELIKPFGEGKSHPILNPYRTVYFIEYIED